MATNRWDETWHRLLEWTNGQAPSERLAAQILLHEGFAAVDPSHPLGGPDGGKDASCLKDGMRWVMGVYFPRGQQEFTTITTKFTSDLQAARASGAQAFVFVTNQELRLAERRNLMAAWTDRVEVYHLERLTVILDDPNMAAVRKQFLGIDFSSGVGGAGGGGKIIGNRGTIIGGRGGAGGVGGTGGAGGSGHIEGDDGLIVGGDGGNCATPDGRGGRAAPSPAERTGLPSELWIYGRGGAGGNVPEYDRRLAVLKRIRLEYMTKFPDEVPFIDAGIDPVPINWVNKRLEELSERWRVGMGAGGYVMPALAGDLKLGGGPE